MSCVKATLSIISIVFEGLLIQSKHYSNTASEPETSDDGSIEDHDYEDSEKDSEAVPRAVPDNKRENNEPVAHHLLEPPEDALSYIAETELAGPAPALLNSEPIQTEGEVSARVSDPDPLFFESEPTCTGRRWKCRDMSGLFQCLCGETAKPNDEGSIQCQKVGCETVWVSSHSHDLPLMCFDSLADSVLSITFSALGTGMYAHEAGPVIHVH